LDRADPLLFDGANFLRIGAEFNHDTHLGVESHLLRNDCVNELQLFLNFLG
jgi:hypothetical protein